MFKKKILLKDPNQCACRADVRVEDTLLTLISNISERLEQSTSVAKNVSVDYSSALKTIQAHLQASKTLDLCVNPQIILWIYNFLTTCSH